MYTLSFKRYRRLFRQPLTTGHGVWEAREGIVLRLEDKDGRQGYGEVAPIPWFGTETVESAQIQLALLGSSVDPEVMRWIPGSHPCCRAAVGAALAQLEGAEMVADRRLPVTLLLPGGDDGRRVLDERLGEGFLRAKVKIGVGPLDKEMAEVERLCGMLPDGGALRLDANGSLDGKTAPAWCGFAADLPIEFIEQPLSVDDPDGLMGLASDFPTPIALDESVVRVDDLKRWRDRGWPGLFVVKPSLAGDPVELLEEIGDDDVFVYSSAMETAIGQWGALRIAFANPSRRALGFGIGAFFSDAHDEPYCESNLLSRQDLAPTWKRLSGG